MLFLKSVSTQVPFLISDFMPAVLSLPKTFVAKRTTPIAATATSAPATPSTRRPPKDRVLPLLGLYPGGLRRPAAALRSAFRRVASCLRLLTEAQHRSCCELDRPREEGLDLGNVMHARHRRERRQQRLRIARGVQPAVQHRDVAVVV